MKASEYKSGNEFAPYHPSASHVEPSYRDGWNACYKAAMAQLAVKNEEVERLKRDATRYQWIIKHAWVDDNFFDNRFGFAIFGANREVPIRGDVGAAIDAAMTQETKP